ncbi:ABC transporter substrate-binding protein [Paenibacillus segetis]|uniref:ABC transporter substrate-binding protein n=1 Tax=Paenibacillus segetis TaxID=1325360 RepID=UPI001669B36E|nr:extracellular solute-binding protein [Paenibacillus segetis]
MKRRNHWLLFAILLLALISLSPSKHSASINPEENKNPELVRPPSQEKVQEEGYIKVVVQMGEAAFLRLQQMNQSFMNVHPLKVDLVNEPREATYSSVRLQLELGESPDIFLLDNVLVRRFAAEGYLLPTESYYFGSLTGEVLSGSLAQNEWNSYVWGVPLDVDPYVLIYNPDTLKKLGVEKLPKSTEEWALLISNFKNQTVVPHLLGLDYDDPYATLSLLWQLGGEKQEDNARSPFKLTEEMKAAIDQVDASRTYLLNKKDPTETSGDIWRMLYNGEVAVVLTRASEATQHEHPRMEISFSEQMDTGRTMWISGRSFVVSAQTDNAEAAGVWISEMTNQAGQRNWYETTRHLPVLKSLYYDSSKNNLPEWIPATLVNRQGGTLPVGATLPVQMNEFAGITEQFLRGTINSKLYKDRLSQIEKDTPEETHEDTLEETLEDIPNK